MRNQTAPAATMTDEPDDAPADREDTEAVADAKAANALTRFDADVLKAMTTSDVMGGGMVAFLPQSMAEAMEFAKLMAASNSVPPHLRGKPGDCLAVVLQSIRWRADPYAVAGKSYFVNNRMAFEAQLVNAVLNTSTVLDGRLQITWQGKGPTLQCTVRGRIKSDDEVHELIQESSTITTKNSPLWKQSERVQLGYYTSRAWGRLFTPEVMLGIYTPDEIEDGRVPVDVTPVQQVIPPRPTRDDAKAEAAAAERTRKEQVGNEGHHRTIMREEAPRTQPAHDAETGEITDDATTERQPEPESEQVRQEPATDYTADVDALLAKIKNVGMRKGLDTLIAHSGPFLDTLKVENLDLWNKVQESISAKKKWFER